MPRGIPNKTISKEIGKGISEALNRGEDPTGQTPKVDVDALMAEVRAHAPITPPEKLVDPVPAAAILRTVDKTVDWIPPEEKIDTGNYHQVRGNGMNIFVLRPVGGRISSRDALVLAAYIVKFADPSGDQFARVLEAVKKGP